MLVFECDMRGRGEGRRRHGWYQRSFRDLPMQGVPVVIRLRKWRCKEPAGERSIFAERQPGLASPYAHQSDAIADVLAVMVHGAGGETSRRLLARLGIVVSGDTLLRHLKRQARRKRQRNPRIVGVDEWAWRRGASEARPTPYRSPTVSIGSRTCATGLGTI